MQQTKIQLLPAEIALVSTPDFILTKNAILQKIKLFFEGVQTKQATILKENGNRLPKEVLTVSPKISRGENYKGLPWLVLDQPRFFQPGNIFAIRTLFWWGNFFSVTLHLSGKYKMAALNKLISNYSLLAGNNFFFSTGDDEWEHDINAVNHQLLSNNDPADAVCVFAERKFLKLVAKFPLEELRIAEENICRSYKLLLESAC
jgi:hypothetical protein